MRLLYTGHRAEIIEIARVVLEERHPSSVCLLIETLSEKCPSLTIFTDRISACNILEKLYQKGSYMLEPDRWELMPPPQKGFYDKKLPKYAQRSLKEPGNT